jgi:hypothetical protein
MRFLPALVLLFLPTFLYSQDPKPPNPNPLPSTITIIPEKLTSDVGRLITISLSVDPKAGSVEWDIPDGFDIAKSLDGKCIYIVALHDTRAADYVVKVYVPMDNKIIKGRCVVTIKGPPLPKPPETGLLADLRTAYAQDGNDQINLNEFIKLFTKLQPYCDDPTITDVGTLMDTASNASNAIFKDTNINALRKVRDRVITELTTQIKESDSTTLNEDLRKKIKGVFSNIANTLKLIQAPKENR